MRLFKSWQGLVAAGAITLMAMPALANEPTSKEREMEQRIAELEAQLENVMTQMQTNSTSQTTLESQIAELQTSMDSHEGADPNGLNMYWNNGIRFDSNNKQFKFKLGGRIMNDYAAFDTDSDSSKAYDSSDFNTSTEFRRARLYIAGTIYGNVGFKAQYDFAGGDADFKDVYVATRTALGKVTVGHHFTPFGLEERTSSKYITFMERGLGSAMSPSRETGVSVQHSWLPEGWHLSNGLFRNSDSFGDDKSPNGAGEWTMVARVSADLMNEEDDDMMLGLGASVGQRKESEETYEKLPGFSTQDNVARVRSRGGQHLGGYVVNTGYFATDDNTQLFGMDAVWRMGAWHAQAEYGLAKYELKDASDADIDGWSAQVGYFLTGETRNWSSKKANWDRTSPNSRYGDEDGDGNGAWEIAARYGQLDATDGGVRGGELDEITIGLNWYLNSNTRVMFNYVMQEADRLDDGGAGYEPEIDIFQMRFQIDF